MDMIHETHAGDTTAEEVATAAPIFELDLTEEQPASLGKQGCIL